MDPTTIWSRTLGTYRLPELPLGTSSGTPKGKCVRLTYMFTSKGLCSYVITVSRLSRSGNSHTGLQDSNLRYCTLRFNRDECWNWLDIWTRLSLMPSFERMFPRYIIEHLCTYDLLSIFGRRVWLSRLIQWFWGSYLHSSIYSDQAKYISRLLYRECWNINCTQV
jgi:hypothetical protein